MGFFLTFFLYDISFAEIYKWRDENNRIHYGDKPGNAAAVEFEIERSNNGSMDREMQQRMIKQQRLLEMFEQERQEKQQQKAEELHNKLAQKQLCSEAMAYREKILATGYVYTDDEQGNRHILSDEEFQHNLAETERIIQQTCG